MASKQTDALDENALNEAAVALRARRNPDLDSREIGYVEREWARAVVTAYLSHLPPTHGFKPTELGGDTCERCGKDVRSHFPPTPASTEPDLGRRRVARSVIWLA